MKWINDLKSSFTADRKVGFKFLSHIGPFMKEEAIIENNNALQKRINDAANHFAAEIFNVATSHSKPPFGDGTQGNG